jgi:hypothetical protein
MRKVRLTGILALAAAAHAGTLFSDAGGGNSRTGDGFTLGARFTVSAPNVNVVALGIYDATGGALLTDHEIGLWDVTKGNIQVADATVLAGANNGGVPGFVFVPLGFSLPLIVGDQYILGAYFPAGAATDHLLDCCQGAAPTANPSFTGISGAFTPSNVVGSLSEPTGVAGHAYVGPNLQFNAPEPGTGMLMLAVAVLIGGLWLRRIKEESDQD